MVSERCEPPPGSRRRGRGRAPREDLAPARQLAEEGAREHEERGRSKKGLSHQKSDRPRSWPGSAQASSAMISGGQQPGDSGSRTAGRSGSRGRPLGSTRPIALKVRAGVSKARGEQQRRRRPPASRRDERPGASMKPPSGQPPARGSARSRVASAWPRLHGQAEPCRARPPEQAGAPGGRRTQCGPRPFRVRWRLFTRLVAPCRRRPPARRGDVDRAHCGRGHRIGWSSPAAVPAVHLPRSMRSAAQPGGSRSAPAPGAQSSASPRGRRTNSPITWLARARSDRRPPGTSIP